MNKILNGFLSYMFGALYLMMLVKYNYDVACQFPLCSIILSGIIAGIVNYSYEF